MWQPGSGAIALPMIPSSSFGSAVFIVASMSAAGAAHVLWLKSPYSKAFSQPLDFGLSIRGRRLFGAHKMLRGLMVMPFASALAFALFGSARTRYPTWLAAGIWELSASEYALLGLACGLAFMLSELPNSFLKRQLDVAPGEISGRWWLKPLCFVLDRCDSTFGTLLAVTATLPVSGETWFWVFILGPVSHGLFSALLHRFGEKARVL